MHIRKEPSFFFTNNTCAPHGEKLGLMNPLLNSSWSWLESSCISEGASLYCALAIGAAPGIKSILNSTRRFGGNPGRPSRNTSGKLRTSCTSWIFLTSLLLSTMWARKAGHFFCRYYCALMHDTIRRLSPDLSPYTIIGSPLGVESYRLLETHDVCMMGFYPSHANYYVETTDGHRWLVNGKKKRDRLVLVYNYLVWCT